MADLQRVGIFQAKTGLACHTLNTAILLEKEGFIVDLFIYKSPIETNLEVVKNNPRINLHIFDEVLIFSDKPKNSFYRAIKKVENKIKPWLGELQGIFIRLLFAKSTNKTQIAFFIPNDIRRQVNSFIKDKSYRCFIGVEKLGIVWAGSIALDLEIPYAYHSLELYTKDHFLCKKSSQMQMLIRLEELYHAKSDFTIIQDKARAEVLFQDHSLPLNRKLALLPVSLLGPPYKERSTYLKDRHGLKDDQVIILQFGHLSRFGLDLTKHFQTLPNSYKLILHYGLISSLEEKQAIITRYKTEDTRSQVYLSLESLSSDKQFRELVSSAHIGLALYPNTCKNNLLTILSSEKIALYLQCGIPIIGFAYPGYEIIEEFQCGVLIQTFEDLEYAIQRIMNDYENYCRNAHKAFLKFYSFEKNFKSVLSEISSLHTQSQER